MFIMRKNCPVCGSKHAHILFNRNFMGMKDIVPFNSYDVNKCEDCGMIYAGDIIAAMSLDEYYDNLSKYETKDYFLSAEAKVIYKKIISFVEQYINKNDHILEIGCGSGNLLYLLKEKGYNNLAGIEPSQNNVEGIAERWNIQCYTGSLGEDISELKNKQYNLVIMSCVLEHILDLGGAMDQLCRCIRNNGYLFLAIPDITSWSTVTDLYQQFSVEHVNYFSLQSLNNLLGKLGFVCVKYEISGADVSYSLWQYNGLKRSITFANDGDAALDMYLKKANSLAGDVKNKLAPYKDKSVYLWGAGTHTAMLYQLGLLDDIKVKAIVDSNVNYHGKNIFGLDVMSPEELIGKEKLPILISSQLAQKSIKKQIVDMCDNEVIELY